MPGTRFTPAAADALARAAAARLAALRQDVRALVARTSEAIEADAALAAPVDTGALRQSVYSVLEEEAGRTVGRIGAGVHYAPHVELGTSRARAQPFLTPAFERHLPRFQSEIAALVRRHTR